MRPPLVMNTSEGATARGKRRLSQTPQRPKRSRRPESIHPNRWICRSGGRGRRRSYRPCGSRDEEVMDGFRVQRPTWRRSEDWRSLLERCLVDLHARKAKSACMPTSKQPTDRGRVGAHCGVARNGTQIVAYPSQSPRPRDRGDRSQRRGRAGNLIKAERRWGSLSYCRNSPVGRSAKSRPQRGDRPRSQGCADARRPRRREEPMLETVRGAKGRSSARGGREGLERNVDGLGRVAWRVTRQPRLRNSETAPASSAA